MKNKKIALRNITLVALIISSFIACDKDFASIESDIINNNNATHFNSEIEKFNVITYNKKLDPVQTNNLPINMLGVYNDDLYGQTTASIVTQVSTSLLSPDFGENPQLESVVLTIPFFSTATSIEDDGETIYTLDSVFGNSPIKLSVYENNYFLRDFDPSSAINDVQNYFSNGFTTIDNISASQLESVLIYETPSGGFTPSPLEIPIYEDGEIISRLAPAIRIELDLAYWQQKIIDKEDDPELSNLNNFKDYFRGIYFKVEPIAPDDGNMMLLNLASTNANITLNYTNDPITTGGDRIKDTYVLTFSGNRVNLLSQLNFPIPVGNETDGDEKLFLKGGEGSMAVIKLFNGDIIDNNDPNDNTFEAFKNDFVETDVNGKFIASKRLINEANLIFYVDNTNANLNASQEPERILLYDIKNNIPLADYFLDAANTSSPVDSRINHLGRLERENDNATSDGVRYKIQITEHIKNLLLKDSTNVNLGLVVSGNINIEANNAQFSVLTGDDSEERVPASSIITPRGTVLYGNNTTDLEKRVSLEIFYTDPNN
ncbi:DUF4270 domain-containing protein [Ichthyenterobacterium magnum]|uniref:Uncharacterized protein DUF4270 n=1 Tax=Ichthyenterobacterium magnum TaxID=1230530 RepID=A0A420DWJ0_9FLAO|nr:DUF4270 domain-containing protein [Ichthyenterobacterium magnum]RKE98590.1 uncharacterized protein DUF4270 [Ichthyenterobacterium magnum]